MSTAIKIHRQESLDALDLAYSQSKLPNWNGDDAAAVSMETFAAVRDLILLLPPDLPSPTIHPEPDGDLCLEWYREPTQILSVSVSSDRQLHWAAKCGDESQSGSLALSREFPIELSKWVKRITS